MAGARVVVEGREFTSSESHLPRGFNLNSPHIWQAETETNGSFSFSLDGEVLVHGTSPLTTGQTGLFAAVSNVSFQEVAVRDTSFGWTEPVGLWRIATNSAVTQSAGAVYRGNPNFCDYTASVQVTLPTPGTGAGLIAGHIDRDNSLMLWLDPDGRTVEVISTISGVRSRETLAMIPETEEPGSRRLSISKEGTLFSLFVDELLVGQRSFELPNGKAGLAADAAGVQFDNFRLSSELARSETSPPQPVVPPGHRNQDYPR
jgi:hypothetical protein